MIEPVDILFMLMDEREREGGTHSAIYVWYNLKETPNTN